MKNSENLIIGKTCSPSEIVGHSVIILNVVLVSYFANNVTYYCTDVKKPLPKDYFYKLTLLDGDVKEVNPRFIVEMEEITTVKVVSDVTNHRHFNELNYNKAYRINYFKLKDGENYEIVDNDVPPENRDFKDRIILSETIYE